MSLPIPVLSIVLLVSAVVSSGVLAAKPATAPATSPSTAPSRAPEPPPVQERWRFTTGGAVRGTCVIWNSLVLAGSDDGNIYALRRNDGIEAWAFKTGGRVRSSGVVDATGAFVVGSDDHFVYALEAATGRERWRFRTRGSVRSSPAIGQGGHVYVGSADNHVYSLRVSDGNQIWSYQTGGSVEAAPVVGLDGTIFAASQDGSLHALDPDTGRLKWKFTPIEGAGTSLLSFAPAVDSAGCLLLFCDAGRAYHLSPAGNVLATANLPGPVRGSPALNVSGDIYTAVGGHGGAGQTLLQFRVVGEKIERSDKWSGGAIEGAVSQPALGASGELYISARTGILHALHANGAPKWSFRAGAPLFAAPALADDGLLVIGGGDGTIHALTADGARGNWPMLGQNPQRLGRAAGKFHLPGEILQEGPPSDAGDFAPELEPDGIAKYVAGQKGRLYACKDGMLTVRWKDKEGKPLQSATQQFLLAPVPMQTLEVGDEIPFPLNASRRRHMATGPSITPLTEPLADHRKVDAEGGAGALFMHRKTGRFYAVRPGQWLVVWKTEDDTDIPVRLNVRWPEDPKRFQLHIAGTPPIPLKGEGVTKVTRWYHDQNPLAQATELPNGEFEEKSSGRSLIVLTDAQANAEDGAIVRFALVRTVYRDDPSCFVGERQATVGEEIEPPAKLHDPKAGGPLPFFAAAPYCAAPDYYDRARRQGPIIPVNLDVPGKDHEDDDLVLIYYQLGHVGGAGQGSEVPAFAGWADAERFYGKATRRRCRDLETRAGWPRWSVLYRCQWPQIDKTLEHNHAAREPSRLIIAAQGSEPAQLPKEQFGAPQVYAQDRRGEAGFNPNDEHAFIEGEVVYALRDDLNTPSTSEPFVLVTYKDRKDKDRPRIKVFAVQAESEEFRFRYTAEAGRQIQPPMPVMRLSSREEIAVSGPLHKDRKGALHARSAGDDGGNATIVTRYRYPVREGYYFPDGLYPGRKPQVGEMVPWLDRRAWANKVRRSPENPPPLDGTPIDIVFEVSWPKVVPELRLGDTLTVPKLGLPDIQKRKSVRVIYQQSKSLGGSPSAHLIDATGSVGETLAQLPADLVYPRVVTEGDKAFFPELPSHLRRRFYFDSTRRQLCFRGLLLDNEGREFAAPKTEAFVLPNVIAAGDHQKYLQPLSSDPNFRKALDSLASKANDLRLLGADEPASNRALTAGLTGQTGYVTLAFEDSPTLNQPGDVVALEVIRIAAPRERGRVLVLYSEDPFSEEVSFRHSCDFGGHPEQFVFQWRFSPATGGSKPEAPIETWQQLTTEPADGTGADAVVFRASGLLTLQDSWVACRYRPLRSSDGWTAWTEPVLAEGWVKRVRRGINPFDQRIKNFRTNPVNTAVAMVEQAGVRARGSVPLTAEGARSFGLIEIYDTVYRRARSLSIDGAPPVNDPPTNQVLQSAAGALADLYMLLGNEAYADAADPTIAYPSGQGGAARLRYLSTAHCFQNQVPSLLEEELALLRGIDGKAAGATSHRSAPAFNRLRWNATRGTGEVMYVLNYGIRYNSEGAILEPGKELRLVGDAQRMYPQGHGDAWGHYLTALKAYYLLLRNERFKWETKDETIDLAGEPVTVDYLDERKFARAAAAKARTGVEIISLTHRRDYRAQPTSPLRVGEDEDRERAWGVADWGAKAGQGAYLDWVAANAMLPPADPEDKRVGLAKIDRTTVPELDELSSLGGAIQAEVDKFELGLNPLGLPDGIVPLDISPAQLDQNKTHFEQVRDRAVRLLNNASHVLDFALDAKRELHNLGDTVVRFNREVQQQEVDYRSRLIEVFGTPYTGDIGPGKTYIEGYDGPDLYHFDKVKPTDLPSFGRASASTMSWTVKLMEAPERVPGRPAPPAREVQLQVTSDGFGTKVETDPASNRQSPGELQLVRSELLQAAGSLDRAVTDYGALIDQIEDTANAMTAQHALDARAVLIQGGAAGRQTDLNTTIRRARQRQVALRQIGRTAVLVADASAAATPKVTGVIGGMAAGVIMDVGSPVGGAAKLAATVTDQLMSVGADVESLNEMDAQHAKEDVQAKAGLDLIKIQHEAAGLQQANQLRAMLRQEPVLRLQLYQQHEVVRQAAGRYAATLAKGQRLQEELKRFRTLTAEQVRNHRYRDMGFRVFRDEAIAKYRVQFDLAAAYAFLAARAFDYETNFSVRDPRRPDKRYYDRIWQARTLGAVNEIGEPLAGGGGLAAVLNEMKDSFDGVKEAMRANIALKDKKVFSLRTQLFRILPGDDPEDHQWRDTLRRHVVSDLQTIPELSRACRDLPNGPGLVIPFTTPLNMFNSLNYFGWPADGGAVNFSPALYATKIGAVEVVLSGYSADHKFGLRANPTVYLLPLGHDLFRSPPVPGDQPGDRTPELRAWAVLDYQIPDQAVISRRDLIGPKWSPYASFVDGHLSAGRQHYPFEARHNWPGQPLPAPDRQLLGRSVYNTRWVLVIPANNLLAVNHVEGLKRFIDGPNAGAGRRGQGVVDILLTIDAYSLPGN